MRARKRGDITVDDLQFMNNTDGSDIRAEQIGLWYTGKGSGRPNRGLNIGIRHNKSAQKKAKSQGMVLETGYCYSDNDGFKIGTLLNQSDAKLNEKIQLVIWCLMHHGITTKLSNYR